MDPTGSNSEQPGAAAASAVAPGDSQTRELLLRKEAGERLTPREHGLLGAFFRWAKKPAGTGGAAPQQTSGPMGNAAPMASGVPGETSPDSLGPVDIDPALCKGVTNAILGRANLAASTWIEREANATLEAIRAEPEARGKMLARLRLAANLKNADQELIGDLSPYVFKELGVNPAQLALYAVGGILSIHAFNLWQCVEELKDLRRSRSEPAKEEKKPEAEKKGPEPVKIVQP